MSGANDGRPKPAGAWTPEQTVEYMFEKVLIEGDFYVICPDNETTPVSYRLEIQLTISKSTRPASSGHWVTLSRTARRFLVGTPLVSVPPATMLNL